MMNGVQNRGGVVTPSLRFPFTFKKKLLHFGMARKYEGNMLDKAHIEYPAVS